MALGTLWYAQQASVKILQGGLAGGTATTQLGCTTAAFDQIVVNATTATTASGWLFNSTIWTGRTTNVTIRGGSRDMTAVNTLGINQLAKQGRPEIMTAEFSLIFENAQGAQYISGDPYVTTCAVTNYTGTFTSTFTRWQYGEKSTNAADRPNLVVLFKLTDAVATASNKTVNCLFNNAYLTNRETSLTADGNVEEKWTIKCLAQDYYEEDNFAITGT
jgi:hypothetical protein